MIKLINEIIESIKQYDVTSIDSRNNIRYAAVAINSFIIALVLLIPVFRDLVSMNIGRCLLDVSAIILFICLAVISWKKKTNFFVYVVIFAIAVLFGIFFFFKYDGSSYFWALTFPVLVFLGLNSIVRVYLAMGYFFILLSFEIFIYIDNIERLGHYDLIDLVRFFTAYLGITFILSAVFWVRKRTLDRIELYHEAQVERIEELEIARAELRSLTSIDPLTRVYNKRYLYSKENNFFQNSSKAYAIALFIDLDDFKKYNDCYGHVAGDHVLMRFAKILKGCLYDAEHIIFRFGGEELLCFVNTDDLADGKKYSEEILEEFRRHNIEHKRSYFGYVSVSIGAAYSLLDSELDLTDLVTRSDMAMYKAKVIKNNWYMYEC